MSDRSNAWYANPDNARRRKARMRAYGRALTELGQRHPDERKVEYRQAVEGGYASGSAAQNQANAVLRVRYAAEFTRLFEEKLNSESSSA